MIGAGDKPRRAASGRPVRILLTAFGPFPGVPQNPSEAVVRRLAGTGALRAGRARRVDALVLDTVWRRLDVLAAHIDALRPDAVVMLGVQSRDNAVRLERVARRHATLRVLDHAGQGPPRNLAVDGPSHLRSRLPVARLATAMRRRGAPVRLSEDAGSYLCNAGLRTALARRVAGQPPARAVFVHIPPPRPARGHRATDFERLALMVIEEIADAAATTLPRGPTRRRIRF